MPTSAARVAFAGFGVGVLDPKRVHGLVSEEIVPTIRLLFSAPLLLAGSLATTVVGVFAPEGFLAHIELSSCRDSHG
jgi:hypothetical protein